MVTPVNPTGTEMVQLTRAELDDAIASAIQQGRASGRSVVDDLLDRFGNRNFVIGAILIYEVFTGHLNDIVTIIRLFLANGGV